VKHLLKKLDRHEPQYGDSLNASVVSPDTTFDASDLHDPDDGSFAFESQNRKSSFSSTAHHSELSSHTPASSYQNSTGSYSTPLSGTRHAHASGPAFTVTPSASDMAVEKKKKKGLGKLFGRHKA
jgi:hypothetical protein